MSAFVASIEYENNSYYDSDSDDDEFIDEQRLEVFDNLIVKHERLIKSYMKNHQSFMLIKIRLMCLMLKRLIYF